ncbi:MULTISPECIES: hypothetical protein [Pseudomonas]|uniref:hypothetical protein n=1 Tax=Pseudomonas TaxID=286 RepID=UPI001AE310DC|nr:MULTISPECIES: hypothetical protein [unclassified Pseudomonas]MBP1124541.1 hypothetical protein [Pseudomonas sp. PvP025]MDQ0398401.1 hypothetical protein [Pseudomonas sp. PvP006]
MYSFTDKEISMSAPTLKYMLANDPNLPQLQRKLLAQSLHNARLPAGSLQADDGSVYAVVKLQGSTYMPLECIHNCRHYQSINAGDVVYGWNLFAGAYADGKMLNVAQYHCVWRSPRGQLLDVTPEPDLPGQQILFMIDSRIKIGLTRNIHTPPLFVIMTGQTGWTTDLVDFCDAQADYFETARQVSPYVQRLLNI